MSSDYSQMFAPNAVSQAALEASLDPRTQEFQELVRLTPATLANYRTQGKWFAAPHLLQIAALLAHELTIGDARIIIEVPPRHGKSELISVNTPIWFLEKFPWAQIILTTYAAELSIEFGRKVRDAFIDNEGGYLKTSIRDDAQKMSLFLTNEGGAMRSVGIGGPVTGKGAHLLIVDDYIKNWEEAMSSKTLDDIFKWFLSTAYTRLEPGGSCVILATRWVIDDLIGKLKEQDRGNMWKIIRYPALAEEDDPLGRKPGEALWPARYTRKALLGIKAVLGDFMFNALYQQNPQEASEADADISRVNIINEIPAGYRWVRSWDLAGTAPDKTVNNAKIDYSVGSLIGTNARPGEPLPQTCIADQVRGQWDPKTVEEKILKTAETDGPGIPIIIEQEPGASGKAWAKYIAGTVLQRFQVITKPAGGKNKWIRAQPYFAAISSGRVSWVQGRWIDPHKDEVKKFPGAKHDDTIDSASLGYTHLHGEPKASASWGRTPAGILVPPSTSSTPAILGGGQRSCTWGRS